MRSALITGASSGIGAALAAALAGPDAALHLGGRDEARLAVIADACRARGAEVTTQAADVRDEAAMRAWIARAGGRHRLDLVIANAGISAGTGKSGAESEAQSRALFAVNLDGVLNTIWPALDIMARQAPGTDGRRGTIAAIASIAAFIPAPGAPAYAASKAAVDAWVLGHAPAAARAGIHLASVCPGFIATPMTAGNPYPMPGLMAADRAAGIILRGLARGQVRIAFPWWMAALARAIGVLPASWALALLARQGGKPGFPEQGLRDRG
jgi:short-subunit dehydrogenase